MKEYQIVINPDNEDYTEKDIIDFGAVIIKRLGCKGFGEEAIVEISEEKAIAFENEFDIS